jgi:hypothetical protein
MYYLTLMPVFLKFSTLNFLTSTAIKPSPGIVPWLSN